MREFKNMPQQYLLPNPSSRSPSTPITTSQIVPLSSVTTLTIGRSHQNSLQLLDNTISKKHAKISYVNKAYYLYDLESANGVFVNGQKMGGKETVLEDGDCVQFGKYPVLYKFVDRMTRNKSKGKSRINLKDYLFQESSDQREKQRPIQSNANRSKNNSNAVDNLQGQSSILTQPISPSKSKQKATRTKKIKPKQSKIRIPDLTDYLKLAEPMNQLGTGTEGINNRQREDQKYMRSKIDSNTKNARQQRQTKIKLQSLELQVPNYDQLKQFRLDKRQRNIYAQQQQALQNIQHQKRRIQQQKLRKQLQNAKIAQDLLQKQLILQQKVRQQQQKVQRQKQRLQEEFVRRQQIKRQEQLHKLKEMEQKQKSMMQKLQQQRKNQIQQLKQKQQIIKQQSQTLYKTQYQKRKKQLEIQAQALARQYQNIYRETIKKVRTQIDNQEVTIGKLEQKEEILRKQEADLSDNIERLKGQLEKSKNMFVRISGRNKACVLYASDIQDKIDAIGNKQFQKQQQGYYIPSSKDNPTVLRKLQQSITTSRKLLKIKSHEHNTLLEQIVSMSALIKQKESGSSSDIVEFVDTVYDNLLLIGKLKEEYLELVEVQRGVQGVWNAEIQENNQLSNKNRVFQSQINKNIREIDQNLRDQIKKSTEQRLHMLKVMHFCPQSKKNAAKFLIQQMLSLQQQIHKFKLQNQQSHKQISKTITQSQKLKRQNQYLSQILFSQDQNGHHFDNMKIVINNIMEKIEEETGIDNVSDCVELAKQIKKYELMVQGEIERKKGLREGMRKIGQLGLAPGQVKISQKNPLIFFGDLFTNKQIEVEQRKSKIANLQDQANALKNEIRLLDQRKSKISDSLQKYKVEQLSQARKYLGK